MAQSRVDRLRKVLELQEQLKKLHETRHALHLAEASAAEREAAAISERIGAGGSLSEVFPEVYHRRVARANERRSEELASAGREAQRVAQASARSDIAERGYRDARRQDERMRAERDQLEEVERRSASMGKPAAS